MSVVLDELLKYDGKKSIDDREGVLEAIQQFCSQSLNELNPKVLVASGYNFVLMNISYGFDFNAGKVSKAMIEELIYLLYRAKYEESFQVPYEKGDDCYTVAPASIAGHMALMIAKAKTTNYYTRRFLKISYGAYAELVKEMSSNNEYIRENFRNVEKVLEIPRSEPNISGNSISNSKDVTLGEIIEIFRKISSKKYIPGYEDIYEYSRKIKDAYLAMYHLFVTCPMNILDLKQKYSMPEMENKYENEFYDYYDGTEIKSKEVNIYE